jgi:hypothetical protein
VAAFQRTLSTCHRQVQELKGVVASLFQAVSAHRFRDVAPDIRAVVIQGIGSWICLHPTDFLQDNYLKYVAWALSDRVRRILAPINECLLHAPFLSWGWRAAIPKDTFLGMLRSLSLLHSFFAPL